ncbi:MAG: NigD-like C-terminal domain-containing protein [bacterium]
MKFKVLFFAVVVLTIFASCDSTEGFLAGDGYEFEDYTVYGAATTLVKEESGEIVYMTDDSLKLVPMYTISAADSLLNQRYYVEFQIYQTISSSTYEVNVVSVQYMFIENVSSIDDSSELDSYADDCITPIWVWGACNYVNLLCYIDASNEIQHNFYLVEDKSSSTNDTINFYIRHDNNDDANGSTSKAAISFDISSFVTNIADSVVLTFSVNDCTYGNYDMAITYKNSNNDDSGERESDENNVVSAFIKSK